MWWYVCILCRPNGFQVSICLYESIYLYIEVYVYYYNYVSMYAHAFRVFTDCSETGLMGCITSLRARFDGGIMQKLLVSGLFSRQLAHSTGGYLKLVLWSPPPLGKTTYLIYLAHFFALGWNHYGSNSFDSFLLQSFSMHRGNPRHRNMRALDLYQFHYWRWWLRNPTNHLGWGMPFFVSRVIMRNHKT